MLQLVVLRKVYIWKLFISWHVVKLLSFTITSLGIQTILCQIHAEQLMSVNGSTVSPCGQTNPEMLEQRLHKENAQRIQMLSAFSQTRLLRAALLLITAAWLHPSFNPLPSIPRLLKHLHCLHTLPHLALLGPFSMQCQVTFHQKESNHVSSITHLPHWSYNPNVIHRWKRHTSSFLSYPQAVSTLSSRFWPLALSSALRSTVLHGGKHAHNMVRAWPCFFLSFRTQITC